VRRTERAPSRGAEAPAEEFENEVESAAIFRRSHAVGQVTAARFEQANYDIRNVDIFSSLLGDGKLAVK